MAKRLCPFDENVQAVKKQMGVNARPREIRSTLSEKTLQLLYKGAAKQLQKKDVQQEPSVVSSIHNQSG
ncbi:hypothetical protein NQ318_014435 [Aromia moschata]|uniref:Uncharacterized protein n=1 Tax=Aromia moschata TaxID=1265417 RepID=A0AAV8Y7Y5_9CUCU|nr:hypothetical protein NQ318_014435 [Aromia moschata]